MCAIFNFTNFINECMFFFLLNLNLKIMRFWYQSLTHLKENLTNSYLNQITYQIFWNIVSNLKK